MKKIFLDALCVTFLSFGFSCYAGSSSQKSAGPYSFAFLTNTLNNTYQSTMADTLKRLASSHGDSYVALDPDYDVNKQVNQMLDLANKHVSLVFLFRSIREAFTLDSTP